MAKRPKPAFEIEYVVLDGMDHSTTEDADGVTETFTDPGEAKLRARDKALEVPGTPFLVMKAIFQAKHPVGEIEESERD
jgi:hypothetical protein